MFKIRRWKRAEQGAFLYKLGLLLRRGYSIHKSMVLLKSHLKEEEQRLIDDALDSLHAGKPLRDIFTSLHLPNEIISSISINSANGNLIQSLIENGSILKKKAEWAQRLNKTIRYPMFLMFLAVWMGILFYRFLFPQFSLLFSSLEIKTPYFTSMMLSVLALIPNLLFLLFISVLLSIFVVFMIKKRVAPSAQMRLLMYIPVFNTFLKRMNSHFFSVNFGSMIKSGLPVTDALIVLESHMNKGFFQEESRRLQKGLLDGKTLPELLTDKPYFSKDLSEIIRFGQAHGELGSELIQYGDWLFLELEEMIASSMQKLQPILFAVIGGFVLLLFASILLPMFKLMEAL
ncbi:type II secretion system F family protein [Fictibacillus nanhaiensis]|uniref:competence type IV pilus assembly protein ComGB n=1 Tax=Fictibacillus nanhaiensis TaxID=742169 RepID=UPI001C97FF59|nr:type II secretion system F family protein [Fictibacillus nanhaiensis]